MELQSKKYLDDILYAIMLIEEFLTEINSFADYEKDIKTRSAVERQLGIIGEAVNKYDTINPVESLENTMQIIGFRNRIIHAYDSIDNTIVWAIIKNHLPKLKADVQHKLAL